GRALIAESGMKISILAHSAGDLAALAEYGKTKEDICNAFHVPLSFLTSETNLANLQAAEHQHMAKAIFPRLQRRDEKLNEQLLSLYDPSGRLFVASEDPVPFNQEIAWRQQEVDLKYGIVTINEVRQDRGLADFIDRDVAVLQIDFLLPPGDFLVEGHRVFAGDEEPAAWVVQRQELLVELLVAALQPGENRLGHVLVLRGLQVGQVGLGSQKAQRHMKGIADVLLGLAVFRQRRQVPGRMGQDGDLHARFGDQGAAGA